MKDDLVYYMGIDIDVVWETIERDIPILDEMIHKIEF